MRAWHAAMLGTRLTACVPHRILEPRSGAGHSYRSDSPPRARSHLPSALPVLPAAVRARARTTPGSVVADVRVHSTQGRTQTTLTRTARCLGPRPTPSSPSLPAPAGWWRGERRTPHAGAAMDGSSCSADSARYRRPYCGRERWRAVIRRSINALRRRQTRGRMSRPRCVSRHQRGVARPLNPPLPFAAGVMTKGKAGEGEDLGTG
ncbi:hypothetical protein C8Q77DRAFT_244809 [Trametes polyzona]|nr:hypothetical protein C8Q77DRAFT_244809 [Trametes polyzona]